MLAAILKSTILTFVSVLVVSIFPISTSSTRDGIPIPEVHTETVNAIKPIVSHIEPATMLDVPKPVVEAPKPVEKLVSGGGDVEGMIRTAAAKYGVDAERLVRIGRCESGFNPNAVNYNYYAGGGNPSGVFQFIPSTWSRMSDQAGFSGASVFDAYSNVNVAAWAFANGRAGEWECH